VPSPPLPPEHGIGSNCTASTQARPRTGLITLVEPRIGDASGEIMRQNQRSVQDLLRMFKAGGYLE
jgi:hypothetical protein